LAVSAPIALGAITKLSVTPSRVVAGEATKAVGTGWPKHQTVTFRIGRPQTDVLETIGRVRTDRRGRFSKRLRIPADLAAGRWVVLACRKACRLKRTRTITVLAPSPYGGVD